MNFSHSFLLFVFKDFFGQNNYCFLTQGHLLKRGGVVNASEDLGGNCLSRHLFSSRKKETINNIQIPTHQLSIIYMLKLAESVCKSHIWRNCNNYFQIMYLVYNIASKYTAIEYFNHYFHIVFKIKFSN